MAKNVYFPALFEPGQIGKLRIKNRIVMSPMGLHYQAGPRHDVTDDTIAYFTARAKGGVGLIIVGTTMVTPMPHRLGPLSLGDPRFVRGHYELVERVHACGAKIGIQLSHSGAQMSMATYLPGGQTLSPSGIQRFFVDGHAYDPPRPMTRAEIYEMIDHFANAAGRAKLAGYDMVEIHGGHGYLIGSFMSPATNKRTDEFGGSLEGRMRFAVEIIKRMKQTVGSDFPVSIRISADEFIEGGISLEESPRMAKILEEAGADDINVSAGVHETLHQSNDIMRMKEGWKLPLWAAIKEAVKISTIAVGGHRSPELCEKVIAERKADFLAFGRQLLADPEWPKKAMEGKVEDIRKCTSCLECLYQRRGVTRPAPRCSVNAERGRERHFTITPATVKKRVMIVGGGVAGMEAARVASLRGHEVTIFEKERELGSQLSLAATPPGKQKWLWFRDYLTTQIKKQGVKVNLGITVIPERVDKEKPDVVVIATGSKPLVPNIPGIRDKRVVTAWDVLKGKVDVKNHVIVILGGGMIGCETAEFLAERGVSNITVVEMLQEVLLDMEPHNRRGLLDQLKEYQVKLLTGLEVVEIVNKGVSVLERKSNERRTIDAELIILALGSQPVPDLAEALEDTGMELYSIGDCKEPRKIIDAVYEGSLIGRQI